MHGAKTVLSEVAHTSQFVKAQDILCRSFKMKELDVVPGRSLPNHREGQALELFSLYNPESALVMCVHVVPTGSLSSAPLLAINLFDRSST